MRFDDSPVDDDQVPPALTLLATKSASSAPDGGAPLGAAEPQPDRAFVTSS